MSGSSWHWAAGRQGLFLRGMVIGEAPQPNQECSSPSSGLSWLPSTPLPSPSPWVSSPCSFLPPHPLPSLLLLHSSPLPPPSSLHSIPSPACSLMLNRTLPSQTPLPPLFLGEGSCSLYFCLQPHGTQKPGKECRGGLRGLDSSDTQPPSGQPPPRAGCAGWELRGRGVGTQ